MPQIPDKDVVSIVVPIYNGEAYLRRCIHSLAQQSYPDLEIILVDDGSRDGSLKICREEAKKDSRIRVICKENGGVASARNAGMAAMTGRWLLLIDGDDHIHPDMVKDLLSAALAEDAQAAICGFEREFADGMPPEVHALGVRDTSKDMLLIDGGKEEGICPLSVRRLGGSGRTRSGCGSVQESGRTCCGCGSVQESGQTCCGCGSAQRRTQGGWREAEKHEGGQGTNRNENGQTLQWKMGEGGRRVWSGSLQAFAAGLLLPLYRNLMLRTQSNKLYSVPLIRAHGLSYPEGFSINEDIWFCVRYLTYCEKIACIPGSYLYYWQRSSGESQISRYHPEGVESCFLLLTAMEELLKTAGAPRAVCRAMEDEMLFHICGFAGHVYYRTAKAGRECYEEICRLAERREFQLLLERMEPTGMKNKVAAFLLGHHLCRLYHWLCLVLYGRQRRAFLAEQKTGIGEQSREGGKQKGQGQAAGPAADRGKVKERGRNGMEIKGTDLEKMTGRQDKGPQAKERQGKELRAKEQQGKGLQPDRPMVSVSCITYNHEAYIARALDSFLMQKTDFPYEILVYDDASTDRTQEIIRQYEQKYPDIIKPYYQTENQYSKGRYNVEGFFCYPRAKGKYIALCDGDDYWTDEQKLQRQVDYMEAHPECALCIHAARIETPERSIQSLKIRPYKRDRVITAEEVIDKPSNYPTASLFFRTKDTRDLQDYYYVSPVGDIAIQIHLAAKGTAYYMDREMSAYQQGVSASWSTQMEQGDRKQKLIDHHKAMKVMYRGFSKETDGRYDRAILRACRRMDFLTLINTKDYREALAPGYRRFYKELPLRTRFFIRFELLAPGLYRKLRKLVYGEDRG